MKTHDAAGTLSSVNRITFATARRRFIAKASQSIVAEVRLAALCALLRNGADALDDDVDVEHVGRSHKIEQRGGPIEVAAGHQRVGCR